MGPNTAAHHGKTVVNPPRPQCERDSDHDSTQSVEEEVAAKHKWKRGYRKGSHTLRKEEIARLRVEMAELQAQMRELQQHAFAPRSDGEEDNDDKKLSSNVLHNVVKKQQNMFVDIQAVMSGYTACSIQCGSPIQRTLVLPNDEVSRRNILRSMKTLKLEDAQERRFENDEDDYWAVRFTTSQFESARSVKQVFDLVVYFLSNSEISISEKMGHLTVREDDDNGEPGIAQHRLVSTTDKGLHMEWNTIRFYEYCEAGSNNPEPYGLIVSEFVDEDERHPYRPKTRIRKDVNVVMEVRAYTRGQHQRRSINPKNLQREKVVVLTLWSHHHLRCPIFPVPKDAWIELRENMDRWTQNMHKTIMETLDSAI